MSGRTVRTWSPMSRSRTWSSRSARSRPSNSSTRFSLVESNFQVVMPETPMLPEVHIRTRDSSRMREISINETPMMLLPKARVRESMDMYESVRHSYGVVADTSTQGLHLSTILPVYPGTRPHPPKSSLKGGRRSPASRSEADSGIGSLKRAVTFDNLSRSQSTVFKSDDDSDDMSDDSNDDLDIKDVSMFRTLNPSEYELPDHLDSFGGENERVIANFHPYPPHRPPSRNSSASKNRTYSGNKRRRHRHGDGNDVSECEICGTVLSERERVEKSFGKVDSFLKWVMSKWGPGYHDELRKELQYIPRPTYVYRGHTPHFCNFVQQVHLHSKQLKDVADSAGIPDSDIGDDLDFIESYEGRIGGKYRKGSNARVSGTEGRPGSPSSLDGGSQNEGGDSERLPVTGVEVRVSSPVKSETSLKNTSSEVKTLVSDDKSLYGSGTHMMIPEEDGTSSNDKEPNSIQSSTSRKKSIDKATQSTGIEDTTKVSPPLSKDKPPPTPQPIPLGVTKPQPPTTPAPERKRSCVTKKTRKPIERSRKMKEPEEVPAPTESPKVEDREPTPVETESEKPSSKLELQVPDLPPTGDTGKKQRKEKSKPKRHLIEGDNEQPKAVDAVELLNEQNRQIRSEIDWSTMDTNGMEDNKRQPQIKSWIQGRLALSQQSSRFELPMDMKRLEKMTPQEYVRKHCIITSRRNNLYQKIFMKNKEKSHTIVYKDLDKTLKEVLVNTITSEQIQEVLRLLDVNEQTKVDFKLFAGMAAYAERILYPKYVTEDTVDMPEYQKEKIESADFSALDWKFHGVNVNPQIKTLLKAIS